jgi:hypothetical protein
VEASVVINRVAYIAIGLLVLVWLSAFLRPAAATLTAWGLMSVPFMLSLGRISSPDPLSTLVVLLGLWSVFERQKPAVGAAFMVGSILVRPDNIVWVVLLAGYLLIKGDRRVAFATGTAGVALYFGLTQLAGSYGWSTLFYHAFIERVNYPATFESPLTIPDYLRAYLGAGHPKNLPPYLALFAILGIWLLATRLRRDGPADTWTSLLALVIVFSVLHWIAYPGPDRFRSPVYAILVIALVRSTVSGPALGPQPASNN